MTRRGALVEDLGIAGRQAVHAAQRVPQASQRRASYRWRALLCHQGLHSWAGFLILL